jgi:alcohol dehydrogenase (cytochrome c)
VTIVLVLAGCGGSSHSTSINPPPAFTAAQLAAPNAKNWIDFGGNSLGQRYSTLGSIRTANAKTLEPAWETSLGEPQGENVGGGLEYDGTYYIQSAQGDVFALDAQTGGFRWKLTGDGAGSGRGLAMGNGLIYAAEKDCYLVAVDAKTGKLAWRSAQLFDPSLGYSFPGPITYTPLNGGEVLVGTGGSDDGVRGYLAAVDASTGKLLWKHSFVPMHKGDPGYSSWGQPADLNHGGGGVWTQPEVDPATGDVIVATANASPYANRPAGDDLYTAADVALNAKTGKMVWAYQEVHHDEWDYDMPQSPTLFDMTYHGKVVHALDQPTKMGLNFVLDRDTGKPVIPAPETPEPQDPASPNTSKTQPIAKGDTFAPLCAKKSDWLATGGNSLTGPDGNPLAFGCIYTPIVSSHYTVAGNHDVADWLPSTYDRTTKLFYICATLDREKAYEAIPVADANPVPGTSSETEVNGVSGGDNAFDKTGAVVAYDPQTNRIAWKSTVPGGNACYAGLASTAGGLVFAGTQNGHFLAFDAKSGKLLWDSGKLDGAVGSSPIVYRGTDGREYVTLIVGGTSEGGNIAVENDTVYAFALPTGNGGPAMTTVPGATTTTAATTTAATTTAAGTSTGAMTTTAPASGSVAAGAKLFASASCASCHTLKAAGATGTSGPDLDSLKPTAAQVDSQVTHGGEGMPAFSPKYSASQIASIAAYVAKSAGG